MQDTEKQDTQKSDTLGSNPEMNNDCDLELTLDLFELFKTPREKRDEAWIEEFFDVASHASLVTAEPQISRGPDGFPYLTLSLPKPNEDFDAVSVHHALDYCLKQGCGIALFGSPDDLRQPEWIFTFGSLWAYRRFGNFIGDPSALRSAEESALAESKENAENKAAGEEGREVMVSNPPEDFLPSYARSALGRFLKEAVGLQEPHVAMITDPKDEKSRSLMFTDLLPERFEKEEHFMQLMTALRWFLPATLRVMVAVPQLAQYNGRL